MEINFLAVFLAALYAFISGFVWYTVVFRKPWQKEIGMNGDMTEIKTPNLGRLLIGSFILELIMALNLAFFIGTEADALFGLAAGLAAGLGWVALAFGINHMFEGKSFKLWLINAGYFAFIFAGMGLIIGAL